MCFITSDAARFNFVSNKRVLQWSSESPHSQMNYQYFIRGTYLEKASLLVEGVLRIFTLHYNRPWSRCLAGTYSIVIQTNEVPDLLNLSGSILKPSSLLCVGVPEDSGRAVIFWLSSKTGVDYSWFCSRLYATTHINTLIHFQCFKYLWHSLYYRKEVLYYLELKFAPRKRRRTPAQHFSQ